MKYIIAAFFLTSLFGGKAQDRSLEGILNFTVGGVWVSDNPENDEKPESFQSFYMEFTNWSSTESVIADIMGVKNNGDTVQLISIWNYINQAENNIFLVQRTAWGAHCTGTIAPFEGQHMDIIFKTTNPDGTSFFTRDIHYTVSENEMRAETYHKTNQEDEWKKAGESHWKRIKS